jgi:hypothetical protein
MKKLIFLLVLSFFIQQTYSQLWQQTLNGISIWSLAKDLSGNIYAGSLGSGSMIYKTTNQGQNWAGLTGGNGQTIFSITIDSMGNIFAANSTAGLLKSTNNGSSFVTIPNSVFGGSGAQVVACGKKGHIYVGTNGAGFYRSIDTANTFTSAGLNSMQIVSLSVDKTNSSVIYAGVTTATSGPNGFYKSTDYGMTFSSNLNPGKNIFGILRRDQGDLFTVTTTTGGAVDRSTNGGLNWTTVSSGYIARGITEFYSFASHILIAGNGGVYRSTNNGITFSNFGLTYTATPIVAHGIKVYAGVSGSSNGGVWIFTDPLQVNNIGSVIPEQFELMQNYPNPFNPSTKLRFEIPKLRFVRLTCYDIQGSEVENLVNEELNPGTYEVDWNASNHPSGVYFYKLTAGDFSETRKAVLIK